MVRGHLDILTAMWGGSTKEADKEERIPYTPSALIALQEVLDGEKKPNVQS